YLKFHSNEFESMGLIEPLLAWWHLMWTDLSRIYETHWGENLSRDPSTMSHSARKIGRDVPPNLKKVDYYPSIDLGYLILDVRILDSAKKLPPIEELESKARELFRAYSTNRGYHQALLKADEKSKVIPCGTPWTSVINDEPIDPSAPLLIKPVKKPKKLNAKSKVKTASATTEKPEPPPFMGDRVLARSKSLMYDLLYSREAAMAVAKGDIRRFYEVLKILLFSFTGSTHGNYANYLLETLVSFELETSEKLRKALLSMMVVCLNGSDCIPIDLLQGHYNKMTEFMVERKGKEFDSPFIRNIISRNLQHFSHVKKDLREGIGLKRNVAAHSAPHQRAELKILLKQYAMHELHSRRAGRTVETSDVDNFGQGWQKLANGKLAKWVAAQSTGRKGVPDEPQETDECPLPAFTFGTMQMVDGELVVETLDEEEIFSQILADVEENEELTDAAHVDTFIAVENGKVDSL
ncbi:hypothetical protein C8J56DRAFT_793016, partial [Mycena floridula]